MGRGLEAIAAASWQRAQATGERVLLTSPEHAYERVVAALERLCVEVRGSAGRDRARGDWPPGRPTIRLEARLRTPAQGAVQVAVAAHPIALTLFPRRRCRRAVRRC